MLEISLSRKWKTIGGRERERTTPAFIMLTQTSEKPRNVTSSKMLQIYKSNSKNLTYVQLGSCNGMVHLIDYKSNFIKMQLGSQGIMRQLRCD